MIIKIKEFSWAGGFFRFAGV